jgi:geranylgeranylglycerol-phosphate geranylgeranyltransferase
MRPYLLPVSAMAGLVGLSLTGIEPGLRFGLAMGIFSLSYGLGQALTDCFQIDTDSLSSPYRPLVKGVVSPREIFIVALAGLTSGLVLLAVLNPWNLIVAAASIVGLLVHTPLKRRWWACAPIENAVIMALLPVMGWLVGSGDTLIAALADPRLLVVALAMIAAYTNFVVVGYLKDIEPDRRTGYITLPVRFGWTVTALVSHVLAAGALAATAWALDLLGGGWLAWSVFSGGAILSLVTQGVRHLIREEQEAHRPTGNVVRVFLMLCGAMAIAARPECWPVAIAIYVVFEVLAWVRPQRSQV